MSAAEGHTKTSPHHDIVDLILEDHVTVKEAYQKLRQKGGETEHDEQIYEKMMWDIAKHAVAEELVFYPLLETHLGKEGKELAATSREDHEKTKEAMGELDGIPLKESRPKVDKMMKDLLEHIEKEETEDLIKVRKELNKEKLMEAAKEFVRTKKLAPQPGQTGKSSKLPYKTPFELVSAPLATVKKFLSEKDTDNESGDTEEKEGYNLRHRDEKGLVTADQEADKQDAAADKTGDGKHGGQTLDKNKQHGNQTPEKNKQHGSGEKGTGSLSKGSKEGKTHTDKSNGSHDTADAAGDDANGHHGKRATDGKDIEPAPKKLAGSRNGEEESEVDA